MKIIIIDYLGEFRKNKIFRKYIKRMAKTRKRTSYSKSSTTRKRGMKGKKLKIGNPIRTTTNPFKLSRGNVIHRMVRFALADGGDHGNLISNISQSSNKGHFSFVPGYIPGVGDLMQQYQYYRINKCTVIFEPCSTQMLVEEADDNVGTNVATQIPMFYFGRYYGTEPLKDFTSEATALSSAGCTYSKITKRNYLTFTPNQLTYELETPTSTPTTKPIFKKWNDTAQSPLSRHFGVRWLVAPNYANTGQYGYRVVVKMSMSFKNSRQNITQAVTSTVNAAFNE